VSPERMVRSREAISKAAKRGGHTIKQLLAFARKAEIIKESVKVNDIVEEVVEFLKETFPEKIVFSTRLEPKLPSINADPNQLQQILINLCVNARDAMPNGGTLTLETSRVNAEALIGHFPEVDAGEYILTKIADTGTGIDERTKSRIFEPFFTTKKTGQGLGLSAVYGITKSHHGFIEVQSEIGNGTEFLLYFPIPPQVIEASPSEQKIEIECGHGETILVVEDEESVQDYMHAVLESNGYTVLLARDGSEAVKTFEEHLNTIGMAIIDMGLPKLSGVHVLSELKRIMPNVKVIFMSGYIEPEIKAAVLQAGVGEFLSKPFSIVDLLEKVQRVLKKA
jgi:CheY-like chemotaxis protein